MDSALEDESMARSTGVTGSNPHPGPSTDYIKAVNKDLNQQRKAIGLGKFKGVGNPKPLKVPGPGKNRPKNGIQPIY